MILGALRFVRRIHSPSLFALPDVHVAAGGVKRRWFCSSAGVANNEDDTTKCPVSEQDRSLQQDALNACLKEKERLSSTINELDDKYKRSLAETENVRKRMQRQVDETKHFGIQSFCKDLLEVADILQLAVDSNVTGSSRNIPGLRSNEGYVKSLQDGIALTQSQLLKVFAKHGLRPLNPIGEKFNPDFHEALFQVSDPDKEAGTIVSVSKLGYVLHQRVIRAAAVGVVRAD